MPTYRTAGAWGAGKGSNLTPAEVDENFYELRTDLDDVIANPPTANSIETITASGFTWTVTLTDGTELDPLPVPVVYTVWRGDWTPLTLYSAADLFRVEDQGIFAVLQDHTSAATFDPDAAAGSPLAPLYTQLIGVASLPADTSIDDLNDVLIASIADGDFLVYDFGQAQWTNRTTSYTAELLAPLIELDDLSDVSAPSPILGQVLTWTGSPASWQAADSAGGASALDDLTDVSVPAPDDGDVLTYQAGSPTGWIASPPAAIPTTLDALSDVAVPTPADGDFLQYESGSPAGWVNVAGTSISGLASVSLPLLSSDLILVAEGVGSPPASYESRKATIGDLGFTLGSTAIALGSTVTTVAGLTLSGGTLSGVTTLPGSGQVSSTGELSLGAAPSALFSMGGTYTVTTQFLVNINATFSSSSTAGHTGFRILPTFTPTGASISSVTGLISQPTIDSTALNVASLTSNNALANLSAGFSGTVTNYYGYNAGTATINGGAITNHNQFRAGTATANNNLASGTRTNRQFYAEGITSGAAGGTLNNRGLEIEVPSGGASSGTAHNRGIYIRGNGGVATGSPPGTVNNHAIYSESTAMSLLTGGLTVGTTTLLTTSVALTNGAAAAAGTLGNAPAAGDPTKWIPVNDNGTTRYIPAW